MGFKTSGEVELRDSTFTDAEGFYALSWTEKDCGLLQLSAMKDGYSSALPLIECADAPQVIDIQLRKH